MAQATLITPSPKPDIIIDGRYRLMQAIGQGGVGAVYKAEHIWMQRTVAIKLLRPEVSDAEEIVKRFSREARLAAKLNDPRCITVHDFGKTKDGSFYLAMEFLEGENLRERLEQQKRLSLEKALLVMESLLEGLSAAHKIGVIHRDIKPENIMLVPQEGETEVIKILDFGIAKLPPDLQNQTQALTKMGFAVGTPDYIAPEQALGKEIDGRADLYAAMIILYEMLAGVRPFLGESTLDVLTAHVTAPPPSFQKTCPEANVPYSIEQVILKGLQKDPEERYKDGNTLLAALIAASKRAGQTVSYLRSSSLSLRAPETPTPKTVWQALQNFFRPLFQQNFWYRVKQGDWRAPDTFGRLLSLPLVFLFVLCLLLAFYTFSTSTNTENKTRQNTSSLLATSSKTTSPKASPALQEAVKEDLINFSEAENLLSQGAQKEAEALLLTLSKQHPSSARVYLLLARAQAEGDNWIDARISFHTARVLDPSIDISRALVEAAINSMGEKGRRAQDAKTFLLKEIGPLAGPLIAEELKAKNARLRRAAAKSLGEIGPRPEYDALPDLIAALQSTDSCPDRVPIVKALGTFGDPRALEVLREEESKGLKRREENFCLRRFLPRVISQLEKLAKAHAARK